MFTYNISFPIEPSRLEKLLGWLRAEMIPALSGGVASSPRLAMVMPGDAEPGMMETVTLQFDFRSEADFEKWESETLPAELQRFSEALAPEALFFATLLRQLPLK